MVLVLVNDNNAVQMSLTHNPLSKAIRRFSRHQVEGFLCHTVFPVNHAVCFCGKGDLWYVRDSQRCCKSLVHLRIYPCLDHLPSQLTACTGPCALRWPKLFFTFAQRKNGTKSSIIFRFEGGSSLDSDHWFRSWVRNKDVCIHHHHSQTSLNLWDATKSQVTTYKNHLFFSTAHNIDMVCSLDSSRLLLVSKRRDKLITDSFRHFSTMKWSTKPLKRCSFHKQPLTFLCCEDLRQLSSFTI